jgi:hypothetical protein
MKNRILVAVLSLAAFSATGCIGFERESSLTGPSAAGGSSALMGSWSSNLTASNLIPAPSSCTDFKWNASEQTGTSARGAFSASCAGGLQLSGTAQGAFTTSGHVNWTATANAATPGRTSCPVTLTGTAELRVDSISIPYEGDTCLGRVKGVETLRRR